MTQLRLMGSDADQVQQTAEAVLRALRASGELLVGDVSVVPNRRGPGARCYIEVLARPAAGPSVTVERTDSPAASGGRPLSARRRALPE